VFAQRGQVLLAPPQSVSVSVPFCAPSVHVGGGAHVPLRQMPEEHWPLAVQVRPGAHSAQGAAPQSVTGSLPFLTPSLQLGAWQQRSTPFGQAAVPHTRLTQSAARAQASRVAQVAPQLPPQSSSVSFWFFVSSLQVGAAQLPSLQTPLVQSLPVLHGESSGQPAHSPPPQSTKSSAPFFNSSKQVIVVHWCVSGWQASPVSQSLSAAQILVAAQRAQLAPPQSMSVSSWLSTPSSQVGAAHASASQRREVQSDGPLHAVPSAQRSVQPPPQSTPASLPLRRLSLQVAAAQLPPLQTPLSQSASALQLAPAAQSEHSPPQSMSVSLPFRSLSLQLDVAQLPDGHNVSSHSGTLSAATHSASRHSPFRQARPGPHSSSVWQPGALLLPPVLMPPVPPSIASSG
jgi:hypothetical protein